MASPLLALLFAATLQDSTPRQAPLPGDAFADSGAARLVASARARRERVERLVESYEATVTQRIGVGIRALRRDRMLYRQELAARISWRRDSTSRIQILGARDAVPVATAGVHVPEDLDNQAPFLAFDPAADYLRILGQDKEGFLYPLAEGSEAHYRFRSGDTTTISLPDGRDIRLIELKVEPRRAEFRLVSGSLWFDAASSGVVRAVFRPARPFDFDLDADSSDRADTPGFVKPIRAEVRYVTIEYGLYEFRWWLPRFIAVDAEASAANLLRVPVRFERVYTGIHATGGSEPTPGVARRGPFRRIGGLRREGQEVDSVALHEAVARCVAEREQQDQAARERAERDRGVQVRVRVQARRCRREALDGRPDLVVDVPADSQALLANALLGEPILQMGDVISEGELRQMGEQIGALRDRPWQSHLVVPAGVTDILARSRFNRVEGFSLGARATWDLGKLELSALGRIGVADLEPNVEAGVARPGYGMNFRLAGYHRLAAADPSVHAFGVVNSLSGLLAGRDDGEYFRATGLELTGRPGATATQWLEWRLYAERQRAVVVETDASLPRLFSSGHHFRPNIVADTADQIGAAVTVRGERVFGTQTLLGAEWSVEGGAGDFRFAKTSLSAHVTAPLGRRLAVGLEGAAGSSVGRVPIQSRFFLGGPATLRGYTGNAANGEAFWRARAELGNRLPAVRIALFGDAGWAGPRAIFNQTRALASVGIGVGLLDGLFRADLARAVRSPLGWRLDFYVDGVL